MISCDFSKPCFWYTEGLEGAQWKWAADLPNALALLSATNALALPSEKRYWLKRKVLSLQEDRHSSFNISPADVAIVWSLCRFRVRSR